MSLTFRVGSDRYWVMVGILGFVIIAAYISDRSLGDENRYKPSLVEELFSKDNLYLNNGTGTSSIHFASRTDIHVS